MKKIFLLLLLFPMLVSAQFDLETFKGKMNVISLPVVEKATDSPLISDLGFVRKYSKKLPSFRLSKENYRQPVSMFEAMAASENYVESKIKISLDPSELGIYGGNSNYSADGSTKVKNIVYKDAGSNFLTSDACPPHGFCARCAPYRMGRSYY